MHSNPKPCGLTATCRRWGRGFEAPPESGQPKGAQGTVLARPARQWSRAILLLLLVTGALDLAGCPDRFRAEAARRTVQAFYDRRLARVPADGLLAPDLRRRSGGYSDPVGPQPAAYRLIQLDRRGARYRIDLVVANAGRAGSRRETEEVLVALRGRRYEIAEIRRTARARLAPEGLDLVLYLEGKANGRLSPAMLPARAAPPGGGVFGVGRDAFGPAAFNPANPREAVISSRGLHALLATAVFPPAGGGKPAVRPVDLFFEGEVTGVLWLPAGNLVAAQVLTPAGTEAVYLYEIADRRRPARKETPWGKRWPPPASVRLRFFAGGPRALVLSVVDAAGRTADWGWYLDRSRLEPWPGSGRG